MKSIKSHIFQLISIANEFIHICCQTIESSISRSKALDSFSCFRLILVLITWFEVQKEHYWEENSWKSPKSDDSAIFVPKKQTTPLQVQLFFHSLLPSTPQPLETILKMLNCFPLPILVRLLSKCSSFHPPFYRHGREKGRKEARRMFAFQRGDIFFCPECASFPSGGSGWIHCKTSSLIASLIPSCCLDFLRFPSAGRG